MNGHRTINELESLREAAVIVGRDGGAGGGRLDNDSAGIAILGGRFDDTVHPLVPAGMVVTC